MKERWKKSKPLFVAQVVGLPLKPFQATMLEWQGIMHSGCFYQGVLAPRGSGKSEAGTIGDALHEVCHDPDIATQIVAESEGTAKVFLSAIKQNFERNPRILKIYGQHQSADDWSTTKITSAQRKIIRKEATIQCLGAAGRIVGRHVQLQWCDDLVSLTNSATEDTRKKLWHWYNTALCPILDPGGKQKIRGTRYFAKDLYYSMIKEYGQEAFITLPALLRGEETLDCKAFPTGAVQVMGPNGYETFYSSGKACIYPQTEEYSYWPERFPLFVLHQIRKKDVISFNLQYQNNTKVLMSQLLLEGSLVVAKEGEIPDISTLICYQGVDPARKTSGDGCLFSITTIGVDRNTGLIYILRQRDQKLADPAKMCEFIAQEYYYITRLGGTIHGIGVETNQFQGVLVNQVRADPQKYGILPFIEKYTIKDKEMRFIACSRFFNEGYVRFHPSCYQLLEDTAEFPDCDLKDRVDSMMHAFETFEMTGASFLGVNLDAMNWATDAGKDSYILSLD